MDYSGGTMGFHEREIAMKEEQMQSLIQNTNTGISTHSHVKLKTRLQSQTPSSEANCIATYISDFFFIYIYESIYF